MEKFKLKEGLLLTNSQEEELKLNGKRIVIRPVWKWLLGNNNKIYARVNSATLSS